MLDVDSKGKTYFFSRRLGHKTIQLARCDGRVADLLHVCQPFLSVDIIQIQRTDDQIKLNAHLANVGEFHYCFQFQCVKKLYITLASRLLIGSCSVNSIFDNINSSTCTAYLFPYGKFVLMMAQL